MTPPLRHAVPGVTHDAVWAQYAREGHTRRDVQDSHEVLKQQSPRRTLNARGVHPGGPGIMPAHDPHMVHFDVQGVQAAHPGLPGYSLPPGPQTSAFPVIERTERALLDEIHKLRVDVEQSTQQRDAKQKTLTRNIEEIEGSMAQLLRRAREEPPVLERVVAVAEAPQQHHHHHHHHHPRHPPTQPPLRAYPIGPPVQLPRSPQRQSFTQLDRLRYHFAPQAGVAPQTAPGSPQEAVAPVLSTSPRRACRWRDGMDASFAGSLPGSAPPSAPQSVHSSPRMGPAQPSVLAVNGVVQANTRQTPVPPWVGGSEYVHPILQRPAPAAQPPVDPAGQWPPAMFAGSGNPSSPLPSLRAVVEALRHDRQGSGVLPTAAAFPPAASTPAALRKEDVFSNPVSPSSVFPSSPTGAGGMLNLFSDSLDAAPLYKRAGGISPVPDMGSSPMGGPTDGLGIRHHPPTASSALELMQQMAENRLRYVGGLQKFADVGIFPENFRN